MNSLDILLDKDIRKTVVPPLAVSGLQHYIQNMIKS